MSTRYHTLPTDKESETFASWRLQFNWCFTSSYLAFDSWPEVRTQWIKEWCVQSVRAQEPFTDRGLSASRHTVGMGVTPQCRLEWMRWILFQSTKFLIRTIIFYSSQFADKLTFLFNSNLKGSNTTDAWAKYFSMLFSPVLENTPHSAWLSSSDSPQIATPVYSEKHLHWNYSTSWGLNKIRSPQNNNRKRAIFLFSSSFLFFYFFYNRCV